MMGEKELETKIKQLENRIQIMEDIEEIKILQRAYGYYYEHCMGQEMTDLWADGPGVKLVWMGVGVFSGKENIKKQYEVFEKVLHPNGLHFVPQVSGIVHVDPDGKTAKGRWTGIAMCDVPGVTKGGDYLSLAWGIYEVEYLKQNGKWKLKKLEYGYVGKADVAREKMEGTGDGLKEYMLHHYDGLFSETNFDFNPEHSGFTRPFHFKHPVTGKKTTEDKLNAALPLTQKRTF
jgi:hypothetical protein